MAEILAPAGSIDCVYAAVRSGANAVYLAGEAFNARRNAENFTYEQLRESVAYCHAHGVKVYHALNTLVKDSEMPRLQAEIERILTLGEDALILQDLGVVSLVKSLAPDMPIHASTQLSAHTLHGVKALEEMGFRRVVLARELSREEIAFIRAHTRVELEVFVHGALCMCVSGQCYMSAFLGARSGNRGLCAQPCRLPFHAPGGTTHDLSLKDNSLLHFLPELEQMGIQSFKIEGRMKRPEYVAASVNACAAALAGTYTPEQESELKRLFSRQGFTDGYYLGSTGKEMFGFRSKEDVKAAEPRLLKEYAALYAKETPRIPCRITAVLQADTPPHLKMCALGACVEVTGETLPEPALHRALNEADVGARLAKLGGTPFFAEHIDVRLENGLMLSAGALNALRREAAAKLEQALQTPVPRTYTGQMPPLPPPREHGKKQLYLRFADVAQTDGLLADFDAIILPIEQAVQAVERFGTKRLILETPRVFFGKEEQLKALLKTAKNLGVKEIAAGNIASVYLAKQMGFCVLAWLGTNLYNSYAVEAVDAQEVLLSPEMSTAQIAALRSRKPYGCLVYGHVPMMISRNCPLKNGTDCAACNKTGCITDRKGEHFAVRCRFGAAEIFNPHALYFADKEDSLQTDFSLLYFTTESAAQVQHVLALYRQKAPADFPFTRGLFAKGVL